MDIASELQVRKSGSIPVPFSSLLQKGIDVTGMKLAKFSEQLDLAKRWLESVMANKPISIQCSDTGGRTWLDTLSPSWDFSKWEYRETPKPREWWAIEYPDGSISAPCKTKRSVLDVMHHTQKLIRLCEVLEEA